MQRLAVAGGLEPQRQLGDFDGFRVEVDAVKIAIEDFAVDVEEVGVAGNGLDLFVDLPVFGVEDVEGSDQKSARTAGGIDTRISLSASRHACQKRNSARRVASRTLTLFFSAAVAAR